MRTWAHLTQAEAARACFVDRKTWFRWEHGYTEPPDYVKDGVRNSMQAELARYLAHWRRAQARLDELKPASRAQRG